MVLTTFEENTFFSNLLNEYNNDEEELHFNELFDNYYFRMIRNQNIHEVFTYFFQYTEVDESMLYTLLYYMSFDYINDHNMSEADTDISDIEDIF